MARKRELRGMPADRRTRRMSGVSRAVTTTQVIIIAVVVVAIGGIYFLTRGDSTSPVAVLRTNSTEIVRAGALVQFSAGDSTDNVGIVSYAWDFGDGTIGTGEDTVHAYSEAGDFTVTLTVADKVGNEESDTTMIEARLIDYWPTTGWRTSTPEEQGMDSERMAEALDFLQEHREEYHIESMLIIRHGYVVADVYFCPYAPDALHDLTSATKSFTSTLIGMAIDGGHIEGVGQTVLDIFQERTVANVDASKRAITVEDLLTHKSGLEVISEGEVTQNQMMATPDWVQFTLDLPMSDEPGEHYVYSNPGVHLISAIIQETTGLNSLDFAQEHLFGPLGISDVA